MFSVKIEENLELKLVSRKYADELYQVVQENLDFLSEWLPWANEKYSLKTAQDFIEMNLRIFSEKEVPGFFILKDNKIIGGIGFNSPDLFNKSIEVGYWLVEDAQGNGVITKSCRILFDSLFNELGFNRIVIRCATENKKSQAIPERLGFINEGISREAGYLNGRFVDFIVYSKLKKEWKDIEH